MRLEPKWTRLLITRESSAYWAAPEAPLEFVSPCMRHLEFNRRHIGAFSHLVAHDTLRIVQKLAHISVSATNVQNTAWWMQASRPLFHHIAEHMRQYHVQLMAVTELRSRAPHRTRDGLHIVAIEEFILVAHGRLGVFMSSELYRAWSRTAQHAVNLCKEIVRHWSNRR